MNKTILAFALAIAFACGAGSALAQQAPAQRYMDAQGVEFIQNRNAPRQEGIDAPRAAAKKPAAVAEAAAADPRLQVSAAEQSARDRDREAILREELGHETAKFEAASKAFVKAEQAARGQPQVGAALKQLKDVLHTHQQNMESLTAELQRTRSTR
ncbi:hypothetical protein [Massilia sp.]|uniref:hypothetical protein n=1 Tax=Massilia sp. TaxID=1882437 RepID=UPI0028A67441|nr:hypothetical protein [Massilia sp.]